MLDRREYVSNEGPRSEPTSTNTENSRALQAYVNRETGVALPVPPEGTDYAELFARLQKLIDNATQTIRDLRRENADLNGRVAQLDSYIQMRAESANNEEELQKSAAQLEELLTLQAALPTPPASEPRPTPAPPTPLRVYEPTAPVAPAVTTPTPELRRESVPVVTNGYAPLRDTTPFTVPPVSPPVPPPMPTPAAPTFSASLPVPHIEAPRVEVTPPLMPTASATVTLPPAPTVPFAPVVEPVMPVVHEEVRVEPQMPVVVTAPTPVAVAVAPTVAPAREPISALAPLPTRRPAPAPASGNEKVAGTYTLVVYPFTRFSDLGQFQSMLQELVGIHDVQVRRFAQGTLEMRLGYDGVTPLPQALHNLSIGIEDVEEEEPYRLRVRLDLNHAS